MRDSETERIFLSISLSLNPSVTNEVIQNGYKSYHAPNGL